MQSSLPLERLLEMTCNLASPALDWEALTDAPEDLQSAVEELRRVQVDSKAQEQAIVAAERDVAWLDERMATCLEVCPLGVPHPPTGIEFCLGCSMCNMLKATG
jgi:succinate dehydrogenase/fumarate reductase-like Fe-S protein